MTVNLSTMGTIFFGMSSPPSLPTLPLDHHKRFGNIKTVTGSELSVRDGREINHKETWLIRIHTEEKTQRQAFVGE